MFWGEPTSSATLDLKSECVVSLSVVILSASERYELNHVLWVYVYFSSRFFFDGNVTG